MQLTDAQQKYTRAKELAAEQLLPQSDLDAAKIAVDSAQADAGVAAGDRRRRRRRRQPVAGVGQPEPGQPRSHGDRGADRRHRHPAQRRRRPDGRGEHAGADAVHHRRRPHQDAGQREHRRSGRRPHPSGSARHVPRRRVPDRHVRRHGLADPPAAGRRAERDDLRHGHRRAEPAAEAQAGHDGEREGRDREAHATCCACRTRRCASGRRPTCSRRSTSRCRPKREHGGGRGGRGGQGRGGNRRRGRRRDDRRQRAAAPAPPASAVAAGSDAAASAPVRAGAGQPRSRRLAARAVGGGRWRTRLRSGAHDGTLQGHVARRTEAVHRADEGSRPGHERVREGTAGERRRRRAKAQGAPDGAAARRRSTRCSRRCRRSSRAAARGCSWTTS